MHQAKDENESNICHTCKATETRNAIHWDDGDETMGVNGGWDGG